MSEDLISEVWTNICLGKHQRLISSIEDNKDDIASIINQSVGRIDLRDSIRHGDWTFLRLAVYLKDVEATQNLLESGADPNTDLGATDIFEILDDDGTVIQTVSANLMGFAMKTCAGDQVVRLLLDYGAHSAGPVGSEMALIDVNQVKMDTSLAARVEFMSRCWSPFKAQNIPGQERDS